jgi:hypothetical protein
VAEGEAEAVVFEEASWPAGSRAGEALEFAVGAGAGEEEDGGGTTAGDACGSFLEFWKRAKNAARKATTTKATTRRRFGISGS